MMNVLLLIISVCCIVLSNGQSAGCGGSDCPSYTQCEKYTRYTLALQNWCNNGNWSIHGLWPDYSSTCYPQYCHSPKWYDVTGSLEQQMMDYWNWCAQSSGSQQSDWEHEWMRHGTCLEYYEGSNFNETDFFEKGLSVYKSALNSGVIHSKCGTPKPNGNCESLCFDLNFKVIDC